MGLIARVAFAIASCAGALCSRQVADEFKAWTPWAVRRLLRRAVRKFPDELQERLLEEWQSHANDIPGEIGKIVFAIRLQIGEISLSSLFEKATIVVFIVLLLPAICFISFLLLSKHGISVVSVEKNQDGTRTTRFRSEGALGRVLQKSSVDHMPMLFDMLAGKSKHRLWK